MGVVKVGVPGSVVFGREGSKAFRGLLLVREKETSRGGKDDLGKHKEATLERK